MATKKLTTKVYGSDGKASGTLDLDSAVFGVEIKGSVVHQVVVAQQANARENIAHTKDRSEVRGGGKKPWRQKGTGRARHGSIRSPIWAGGGVTFGPRKERNFTKKVNKKMKRKALQMTLTDKVQNENLVVIDQIALKNLKTRELKSIISKLPKTDKSNLIVLAKQNQDIVKSSANLPKIKVILADSLNVVDVLKYNTLIVEKEGVNKIVEVYK